MAGATTRAAAAQVLVAVLRDQVHLGSALQRFVPEGFPARDTALVQELCYGVLRFRPRLEFWLARLLQRPLKAQDLDVHVLLLAGLYQLTETRVPSHAAVKETAEACRYVHKEWAVKLVNAVLRRFEREQEALRAACLQDAVARYLHPDWFMRKMQAQWPLHWQAILEAGNQRPPLSLRVNRRTATRAELLQAFAAAGIAAHACSFSADGVVLAKPLDVESLPGFATGKFSVQDEAAQLAAELLQVQPGMRVLDACAAPGGKTGHLLERYPDAGEVVALDNDGVRMHKVRDNLRRLGLTATLCTADAARPHDWWDGRFFQRILLDAPCSASGVIRRHPDIKSRRTPAQVSAVVALQAQLLAALWPLLAPGGKLLYATCSLLAEENAQQLAAFLAGHGDARPVMPQAAWGMPAGAGRQILPGQAGMDGFYYAVVEKS